jgi:hypothetical protein
MAGIHRLLLSCFTTQSKQSFMSASQGPARTEGEVNDTDARLWHPWLRINRVLRVMLHTRWSAEAWQDWPKAKPEIGGQRWARKKHRRENSGVGLWGQHLEAIYHSAISLTRS